MGLMLSILVGCVGVLELLACLRRAIDGVAIDRPAATPCLPCHQAANDAASARDSVCSFSHSSAAGLPRGARNKLENLHEYGLRIRAELRSRGGALDCCGTLSECSTGDCFVLDCSGRTPDCSRLSPDFDYLVRASEKARTDEPEVAGNDYADEASFEDAAESWRIESSSRDRPLSVVSAEPGPQLSLGPRAEKYVRIPTPIPFSLDDDESSSGAASDAGTSFENDSGNEAPTVRSLGTIPVIRRRGSSGDESERGTLARRAPLARKSASKSPDASRLGIEAGMVRQADAARGAASQRRRAIKSSGAIARKPRGSKTSGRNGELSRSADNLTARRAKRPREPERRKSDISVQTSSDVRSKDEWTNTSPRESPPGSSSRWDDRPSVSVQVQTSLDGEAARCADVATPLERPVLGRSESERDLASRHRLARRTFKTRRFGSGSGDKADQRETLPTNAVASVQGFKEDEPRLLKISSFEEADTEDYERVRRILSDTDSRESEDRRGTGSLSSFEDEEYWDAEDLIFSGEYTKAMNKDWHSGHFCCWQCDESLTGQRYVLRDEHPYCIKCYESVFANGCEECNKIIGIDSKDLSYKDKHWHEACFLCNRCRVSLVDKQFGSKVDKIYCGNCYDAQFASRCDGCGEIFRAGTKKMEYKTRQWHEKCFCCVVCKNPIGTKSFIPREQEIYCAGCYEDKFATRCVKCNKIITSGGVTYKNEPWHRDCFTCSNCNNSLAGQRFTSRDDKPYCADCFGELFAKRCTACSKPITGIGGTRFISFEDRHWHNDCFICAGCKTSLVGRGFITDAEDIICPDCAKMKLM